ncbi:MAG TPA: hypothetical protein VLM18_10900 [Croceibacterium sp.]|nr:hypothetical protein [Croceibacterium sp.]
MASAAPNKRRLIEFSLWFCERVCTGWEPMQHSRVAELFIESDSSMNDVPTLSSLRWADTARQVRLHASHPATVRMTMKPTFRRFLALSATTALAAALAACGPNGTQQNQAAAPVASQAAAPSGWSMNDLAKVDPNFLLTDAKPLPQALPMRASYRGSYGHAPAYDYGPAASGDGYYTDDSSPDDYQWLAKASALGGMLGNAPPDYAFDYNGVQPWAWETGDRYMRYAEPVDGGYRYYYYEPDSERPFLVSDPYYSYGYRDDRLVAIYDREGRIIDARRAERQRQAAQDYFARARQMYQAAHRDQRVGVPAPLWQQRRDEVARQQRQWEQARQQRQAWQSWDAQNEQRLHRDWAAEALVRRDAERNFAGWQQTDFKTPPPKFYTAQQRQAQLQQLAAIRRTEQPVVQQQQAQRQQAMQQQAAQRQAMQQQAAQRQALQQQAAQQQQRVAAGALAQQQQAQAQHAAQQQQQAQTAQLNAQRQAEAQRAAQQRQAQLQQAEAQHRQQQALAQKDAQQRQAEAQRAKAQQAQAERVKVQQAQAGAQHAKALQQQAQAQKEAQQRQAEAQRAKAQQAQAERVKVQQAQAGTQRAKALQQQAQAQKEAQQRQAEDQRAKAQQAQAERVKAQQAQAAAQRANAQQQAQARQQAAREHQLETQKVAQQHQAQAQQAQARAAVQAQQKQERQVAEQARVTAQQKAEQDRVAAKQKAEQARAAAHPGKKPDKQAQDQPSG